MAWTTPRTWVTSEIVTAALLNTHLRDNFNVTLPGIAAAAGDTFYASGANTGAVRSAGSAGQGYIMNAGATAPIWGAPTHLNEFRLTLETGVPVSITAQTAKTTVYLTPYIGDRIALFNGTDWIQLESAEVSVAVPATTNTPFDIFAYDNSGTLTLEVLDWTDGENRATAIVKQDGVWVKSGATTRRYIGTGRTSAPSGKCEDSESRRFLWNNSNRVPRVMSAVDTTDSWTYTTATYRSANASSTAGVGRFNCVIGVADTMLEVVNNVLITNASQVEFGVGVGIDSTTVNSAQLEGGSGSAGTRAVGYAHYKGYPAIGFHFIQRLELSEAVGTTTWYGDASQSYVQWGMIGVLEG